MMKAALVALILTVPALPALGGDTIVGRASVVDGDTIDIGKVRVRFHGVDAPETSQRCTDGDGNSYRCGREAAFALDEFLAASRPTSCELAGRDRDRRIGTCYRADGVSVNRWLAANGYAVDWPKYSKGKYAADQADAQAKGLGIWRGEFRMPCEVRGARC